jgi:hypothetical protein
VKTVETLLKELEDLVGRGLEEAGEGIRARNSGMVAARLLGVRLGTLDHAYKWYEHGIPRTQLLEHLSRRLAEDRGFEVCGYDASGFGGFYLKVPVKRSTVLVGPDERSEVLAEFWAVHREEGLVIRSWEDTSDGEVCLSVWSRESGSAFRFLEAMDREVEGCALVRRRAVRVEEETYSFLAFRPPVRPPRYDPDVEAAVRGLSLFLASPAEEEGERLGSLWYGPPGNGKTSLVRSLFREHEDVTRLWIGPSAMSAHTVGATFKLLGRVFRALTRDERVLVVFEDVDLVAGQRGSSEIRTWLSALDGIEQFRCRICFVGLTNLSPSEFDPAVVRPGRLGDLLLAIGPPGPDQRRLILEDHLEGRVEAGALDRMVARTHGFSGAEVELLGKRARWAVAEGTDLGAVGPLEALLRAVRPQADRGTLGFNRVLQG